MSPAAQRWTRRSTALAITAIVAWSAWFALTAGPRARSYASRADEIGRVAAVPAPEISHESASTPSDSELLNRAIAATLWDDLFPERAPVAEAPPPPPPTLDLIAVIGEGDTRYAVLHDRATNVYYNARVGEPLTRADLPATPARNLLPLANPLVARLLALGDHHAVLDLAGREVRIEATP